MKVRIGESGVAGRASAPPSKSYTHRAILAAGYADGALVVDPLVSADTRATIEAVRAFGGTIEETSGRLAVTGFHGRPTVPEDVIDCANSGTTIRLITATAALVDGTSVLTGDASLRARPHGPLLAAIRQLGGRAESTRANGRAPLVVSGPIDGGRVAIPGDVSSQFVTALLMAGAVTPSGIRIDLETELKSAPYVDITREVLAGFGVTTERTGQGFAVSGEQTYDPTEPVEGPAAAGRTPTASPPESSPTGTTPSDAQDRGAYNVPGDFSSISYLLAAGAVAGADRVVVENARPGAQGDRAIVDILDRMGATVTWDRQAGRIVVSRSSLSGVTVDVGNTPDLLPTIATLGAVAEGETTIDNCEHVRYKETDRVSAMAEELAALGASVTERDDALVIHGDESQLTGAHVDGRNDHRIVMALAVAGLVAEGTTVIDGGEHVDVSFPGFFDVLADLGATIKLP